MKKQKILIAILVIVFCTSLFSGSSLNAYQLNGRAFPSAMKGNLTVYILPGLESIYSNVMGSTTQWSGLEGIYFSRMYEMYNPAISQTYVNTDNGTYGVCYFSSNSYKEISYHVAFKNANSSIKAETVVHEVGHALGLNHTQSANNSISVMRATGFNGAAYPLSDDRAGIRAIY